MKSLLESNSLTGGRKIIEYLLQNFKSNSNWHLPVKTETLTDQEFEKLILDLNQELIETNGENGVSLFKALMESRGSIGISLSSLNTIHYYEWYSLGIDVVSIGINYVSWERVTSESLKSFLTIFNRDCVWEWVEKNNKVEEKLSPIQLKQLKRMPL